MWPPFYNFLWSQLFLQEEEGVEEEERGEMKEEEETDEKEEEYTEEKEDEGETERGGGRGDGGVG